MKLNNKDNAENNEMDEIDEKIDHFQKQQEGEAIALKKLLEGLEKIGKSNSKKVEIKKEKIRKRKTI
jgi:hypothetical protein